MLREIQSTNTVETVMLLTSANKANNFFIGFQIYLTPIMLSP